MATKSFTFSDTNSLDTQTLKVNIGPQHPSTHGVFRMDVVLDGENILELKPVMGYLHRNHEQIAENISYTGSMPYTDRLDYFNSMTNNFAYAMTVEKLAGITPLEKAPTGGPARGKASKGHAWSGKTFFSKEGLPILVGRNKTENLELTFKVARGNDLWMHVRGRPGAHVVIPLNPGKTASLETLLDAATLTLFYSGGEKWGKTEVDYTFKKHVKRIKDSTEASYTHNKTLVLSVEPARMKRLMG
jgi:hypothetical protein